MYSKPADIYDRQKNQILRLKNAKPANVWQPYERDQSDWLFSLENRCRSEMDSTDFYSLLSDIFMLVWVERGVVSQDCEMTALNIQTHTVKGYSQTPVFW